MLSSGRPRPLPSPEPSTAEPVPHGGPLRPRAPADTAEDLFGLRQIASRLDPAQAAVWCMMRHQGRPAFTPSMLQDLSAAQDGVAGLAEARPDSVRYLIFGSLFPSVFCLGGDLEHFVDCVRARDRAALTRYGRTSIKVLHRNLVGLDLPIITIGLVQGDALGGGFETLLSFNVIVAEKGSRFGLPETVFGLFPGMGAHVLLTRRLGAAQAQRMILSGSIMTAEELYGLGLVHVLAEPGQGERAVRDYIAQNARRHSGHCGVYAAQRVVDGISLAELEEIVEIWVETTLRLTAQDLKMMRRLILAQNRLLGAAAAATAAAAAR
jgi:DSF synthase